MKSSHVRGDYVFKEVDGNLEFVGDFNGLYKNDSDPWDQSATTDQEITYYYKSSRKRLIEQLNVISPTSILEIGCGLGYTTKTLQDAFPKIDVTGMDISDVAIKKAGENISNNILCSDAFFPFRDSIDKIANTGIKAVIQPGGSMRDNEVISACNEHQIAMVFTGKRCFKH